jgi:hypothetical protein
MYADAAGLNLRVRSMHRLVVQADAAVSMNWIEMG